jgi:hypothetical protein
MHPRSAFWINQLFVAFDDAFGLLALLYGFQLYLFMHIIHFSPALAMTTACLSIYLTL